MARKEVRKYTLKTKDIPLLDFSLIRVTSQVDFVAYDRYQLDVLHVYEENRALMPKELLLMPSISGSALADWLKKRKLPRNRQFGDAVLRAVDKYPNAFSYIDTTNALSLVDCYWVVPRDKELLWKDCSLYTAPFDEQVAEAAFTGKYVQVSGRISTPEITTDGALKKCWVRQNGVISLQKGDGYRPQPDGRSQVYMEWLASQVAQVMGFAHVPYTLESYIRSDGSKETTCLCPLFTNEDTSFVSAYTFFRCNGIELQGLDTDDLQVQVHLAEVFGREVYEDMQIFDGIICNTDRHYGNFGYLVDTSSGKFLRPAPLFDNGRSFFCETNDQEFHKLAHLLDRSGGSLRIPKFDLFAKLFVEKRHLEGLKRLTHFNLQNHSACPIRQTTLDVLTELIHQRAKRIIDLYEKKEFSRRHLGV